MKEVRQPWIEEAYVRFARGGPSAVQIEPLARSVGKSKSSFYHLFADGEGLTAALLNHHRDQSKILALKEAQCTEVEAWIEVLLAHKTDVLFNRQLRIHRDRPDFRACFEQTVECTLPAIVPLWARFVGMDHRPPAAETALRLSIEHFFFQITEQTLQREWLAAYFHELQQNLIHIRISVDHSGLDGAV
ncbi:TetR family transcriptional regulator [bacterium]|nr:TetR family transcriptional regulator [bacterium]